MGDAERTASYTESFTDDAESIRNDEAMIENMAAISDEDAPFLASISSYDSDDSDFNRDD